jgi:hypothetical protein
LPATVRMLVVDNDKDDLMQSNIVKVILIMNINKALRIATLQIYSSSVRINHI